MSLADKFEWYITPLNNGTINDQSTFTMEYNISHREYVFDVFQEDCTTKVEYALAETENSFRYCQSKKWYKSTETSSIYYILHTAIKKFSNKILPDSWQWWNNFHSATIYNISTKNSVIPLNPPYNSTTIRFKHLTRAITIVQKYKPN